MEAEIAAAVAQAVVDHDTQSAWHEELANNAETIALILITVASAIAGMVRTMHKQDKRLVQLETLREHESRENHAAHGRLEGDSEKVLDELRAFRGESKDQHDDLGARLDAQSERLAHVESTVARLVGRTEAHHPQGAD